MAHGTKKYRAYPDQDIPKIQDFALPMMAEFVTDQTADQDPKELEEGIELIGATYDRASKVERRLINLVLVAITGWSLPSIIEKGGG